MAIMQVERHAAVATTRTGRYILRSESALAQLLRFTLVGGIGNVSYVLLFLGLHGAGPLLANVVGSVVSTGVSNELHRRLTFHAADRVDWSTAQWEGGGLALLGLAVSTAALAALNLALPHATDLTEALSVIGVSAVVGAMRFVVLRGWVF